MSGESSPPPVTRYEKCLLCPCNAGTCRLFTSQTVKNPDRRFYRCPEPERCFVGNNGFFKWADEVRDDELIDVPYCGGCMAGLCRVRSKMTGPNAGRIKFLCRIKKGQGSCGYKVWLDELKMTSAMDQGNPSKPLPPSTPTRCNDTGPTNFDLVDENEPTEKAPDNQSDVISISPHLRRRRSTSRKIKKLRRQEDEPSDGDTLNSPLKKLRSGVQGATLIISDRTGILCLDTSYALVKQEWWMIIAVHQNLGPQLKGWWGRLAFYPLPSLILPGDSLLLDPIIVEEDHDVITSGASTTPTSSSDSASESFCLFDSSIAVVQYDNPVNIGASTALISRPPEVENSCDSTCAPNVEPSGSNPFHVSHNVPPCDETFAISKFENSVVSESVSKAFKQAAEHLQNDLLTLLEKTEPKDHEAMSKAAEETFAALDHLCFNHQQLDQGVNKYIKCAMSLAAVEQPMPINDSYQKLESQCSTERMKLDEMNSLHDKAVEIVSKSRNSLELLRDIITSTKEWLFQVEAELLCSEVELRSMERQLEQNSKDKKVLERNYINAAKELEYSVKLQEQREAERDAAKFAFDKARALLRG